MQAAGGVYQQRITAVAVRLCSGISAYLDRIHLNAGSKHRDVQLFSQFFELFNGSRPIHICRHQVGGFALLAQQNSQLAGGRCFAGSLKTYQHHGYRMGTR